MKRIKKLASLLLAMVMVLAMGTTVFAAEAADPQETGSITIKDVKEGAVYNIYRIFDLESYNADKNLYSYKVNAAWSGFFAEGAPGQNYVDISDTGYVTWKEGVGDAAAAALAKEALAYAKANAITPVKTTEEAGEGVKEIKVEGLPLGYYLLDSTVGTLCSLNTTNPDVNIADKNQEPTNEKEVEEDSNGNYGSKDDADIGQTVNFRSTITAQEGAQNYIFHDKMSDGLTFGEVTGITLNGEAVDAADYTVLTGDAVGDNCTFEVVFVKAFCDALVENDSIVISYTATLNENAVIAGANPNESKLTYGENNEFETTPSVTETFTWKFGVLKYVLNGEEKSPLAEAEFTLSKNEDGSDPIKFIAKGTTTEGGIPIYQVAEDPTAEGVITTIVTDATGQFILQGLDSDTYYLTETKSPDGYNELDKPVKVVIDENGNVTANGEEVAKVEVENKSGSLLPSTGGIGTTIFYVIGGILVVAAGVLLVTKKRMKAE